MTRGFAIFVVLAVMLWGGHAAAAVSVVDAEGLPFEEGLAAFEAGDYPLAAQKWHEAASEGIPQAQYNLGTLYYSGRGVEQDLQVAAKLFELAGTGGVAEAQYNLGAMFLSGNGVPRDLVEAFVWLGVAARSGFKQAVSALPEVAAAMTPEERSQAAERIQHWKPDK